MDKAGEKIAAASFQAQKLGQLRGGDVEGRARLEARDDRIGEEIGQVGEAQEAAANGDHADHESEGGGQGRRPHRITAVEEGDAGGNGQCQCRRGAHRQLPAGAKHGVRQTRGKVTIKAGYRRQAGQRGIGQRFGDHEGGQRQTGNAVRTQPLQGVAAEPLRYGEYLPRPHRFSRSGCVVQLSIVAPPGAGRRSMPDRRTSSCPTAPAA